MTLLLGRTQSSRWMHSWTSGMMPSAFARRSTIGRRARRAACPGAAHVDRDLGERPLVTVGLLAACDWNGRTMTGARKFLRYCTHSRIAAMRAWSTSQRVAASVNAGSSVPMSAGSARPMSFSWMTNSLPSLPQGCPGHGRPRRREPRQANGRHCLTLRTVAGPSLSEGPGRTSHAGVAPRPRLPTLVSTRTAPKGRGGVTHEWVCRQRVSLHVRVGDGGPSGQGRRSDLDGVLDAVLAQDPYGRVACETS